LGLFNLDLLQCPTKSLDDWWLGMTGSSSPNRKAVASITILASWKIWNERNVWVFRNKHVTPSVIFEKIKKRELKLWVTAGAKRLRAPLI
jgi:hypothetical protein